MHAPLVSLCGLMLNRLLGVLVGRPPSGQEKAYLQRAWVAGVLFYRPAWLAKRRPPRFRYLVA